MNKQILDSIPMWAVYPLSVLALLAFLEAGYWLGKFLKRKSAAKNDAGIGAISGATLALLAFLLAFTVSFAVGVFGERRIAVLDEANAIGTTYLRAGFLLRSAQQGLLRVPQGALIGLRQSLSP